MRGLGQSSASRDLVGRIVFGFYTFSASYLGNFCSPISKVCPAFKAAACTVGSHHSPAVTNAPVSDLLSPLESETQELGP